MTRALGAALAGLLALAACAPTGAPGAGGGIKSGGAAGRMGPGYCHSVPTDISERTRWNNLCFSRL